MPLARHDSRPGKHLASDCHECPQSDRLTEFRQEVYEDIRGIRGDLRVVRETLDKISIMLATERNVRQSISDGRDIETTTPGGNRPELKFGLASLKAPGATMAVILAVVAVVGIPTTLITLHYLKAVTARVTLEPVRIAPAK